MLSAVDVPRIGCDDPDDVAPTPGEPDDLIRPPMRADLEERARVGDARADRRRHHRALDGRRHGGPGYLRPQTLQAV